MVHSSYPLHRRTLLADGCIVVADTPTVIGVSGPGAAQCLQGLLTNDLLAPGPEALTYAALLTPKGMITADYWVIRQGDAFTLIGDRPAREVTMERLARALPPRLARVTDRTGDDGVLWLLGPGSGDALGSVATPAPAPGTAILLPDSGMLVATPRAIRAPFRHLVSGPAAALAALATRLAEAGATPGDVTDLRVARILAGFPTLGAEIDDRTMPAEVDFDALEGVSHKKGCYVGQETVARLHFRGHANWLLRGLETSTPPALGGELTRDGKPVVRIGTAVTLSDGTALALARVRREVEPGGLLDSPEGAVTVVALPFPP